MPGGHPLWYHYWDICPRGRRVGGNGSVPPHALVFGNPARQHGYVCRCAERLTNIVRQWTKCWVGVRHLAWIALSKWVYDQVSFSGLRDSGPKNHVQFCNFVATNCSDYPNVIQSAILH